MGTKHTHDLAAGQELWTPITYRCPAADRSGSGGLWDKRVPRVGFSIPIPDTSIIKDSPVSGWLSQYHHGKRLMVEAEDASAISWGKALKW